MSWLRMLPMVRFAWRAKSSANRKTWRRFRARSVRIRSQDGGGETKNLSQTGLL